MDGFIDDSSAKLARRVHLEREARGWSLAELAEGSGVSKAAISKIERGEVSPTAVVLVRLAAAFDLTLAGLLLRAEGDTGRISRAAEQPTWRDPETGYVRRQIYSRPDHPLDDADREVNPPWTGRWHHRPVAIHREQVWSLGESDHGVVNHAFTIARLLHNNRPADLK